MHCTSPIPASCWKTDAIVGVFIGIHIRFYGFKEIIVYGFRGIKRSRGFSCIACHGFPSKDTAHSGHSVSDRLLDSPSGFHFMRPRMVLSPIPISLFRLSQCRFHGFGIHPLQHLAEQLDHLSEPVGQIIALCSLLRCPRRLQCPCEPGVIVDKGLDEMVHDLALVFGHGARVMVHDDLHGAVADLVHGLAHGPASMSMSVVCVTRSVRNVTG